MKATASVSKNCCVRVRVMSKKPAEPTLKPIKLGGGIEAVQGDKSPARLALLLWGPPGAGKTSFAATAPGLKLWFAFGDNEAVPVSKRKDVQIADLSGMDHDELFRHAQNDNPFGLDKVLAENEEITTVVVDSATAIAYMALLKSVLTDKTGAGGKFVPTMSAPGIAAYGGRNAITLQTISGFLRVTAKHGVHVIVTGHEDTPTMKKEDRGGRVEEVIDYIGIQLGGRITNDMAWRWSEIWHLRDADQRGRLLTVRNYAQRRPMKTRMFTNKDKLPMFELVYDASKPDDAKGQMTIAGWYEQWLDGGRESLPIPHGKGQ